ncbi:MAG: hypothetical protein ACREQ5_14940, partial [Candidatus Dormibacteria bacterium]
MTDQHGAGLGRALSRILGDTIIHATATSADHLANAKSRSVETKMEEAEEILRPVVSALIKDLLGMDALPDNWRPFLEAAAGPSHQFDWVLQGAAMLGMVIGSLGALGKIDLQPLVNQYWSQYPTVPISPADLADMVERNIMPMSTATEMAAESGVNSVNFGFMVEDTGEPYGIEQALSLLRRGLISEGD